MRNFPASYRISLHAQDSFCEYDTGQSPYTHTGASNAISYVVDLSVGKIAQQCQKCRPRHLKWVWFIHDRLLEFDMMTLEESKKEGSDVVTVGKGVDPAHFFLRFNQDSVLYARDVKQVYVYDEATGVWLTGTEGNRLLHVLITNMNQVYMMYRRARNAYITDKMLADWQERNPTASSEEVEKKEKKLNDDCKKSNQNISPLWILTMQQKGDLVNKMKVCDHPNTVDTMEPFKHLVPLLNRKCLDIYSFKVQQIEKTHHFTSRLNGSIIDLREASVKEFADWQLQVCCGDEEYVKYKFWIFGLSLTTMNFDRCFYMAQGAMGRNGKSSEVSLFTHVTMGLTPARGYILSREYLTKTSQDRKGANAPDTVLIESNNKAVVIADECRDSPLDCALIKSFVSGDPNSARNLYETERTTITASFTLWIVANKTLKIDYSDSALMNRMRLMPYNAQWVRGVDLAAVRKKVGLPGSLFVFKEDPYFKDRVLKSWGDAFVTKCLWELHLFLKQLPDRDPENPEHPARLCSFPVPSVIQKFTTAKIQQEHPILAFIDRHLGTTDSTDPSSFLTLEDAFEAFRRFARNDNSIRAKHMSKTQFQEALEKEHIDVLSMENGDDCLQGYYMKKEVPCHESRVDAPASVGHWYAINYLYITQHTHTHTYTALSSLPYRRYIPPVVVQGQKRPRDDFYNED